MRCLIFVVIFLFIIPSVLSISQCLNGSYLQSIYQSTICYSGTCSVFNNTELRNCTNGCDLNLNQCKYEIKSDISYIAIPVVLSFTTGVFFFLGIKVQPGKEFSLFKNGIQTLFFFLGLWFVILNMGIINSIATESGVSLNTSSLINTGIVIITYIIYFVMIIFVVSYLVVVLMMMIPKKRKPFQR